MSHRAFADKLDEAACRIAEVSRAELQVMLRNAALRLRNASGMGLDPEIDHAVNVLVADLKQPKSEILESIVRDWLIIAGRWRADARDEGSETDGIA
jgi:hypothetical protein